MVRLALIGGAIEHAYAAATSRVPGAVFTAVVDDDAGRAERMATTLGAAVVAASLHDLLHRHADTFDAALIHSAPDCHAAHAEPIARAGHSIHLYDYADPRVRAATAAALAGSGPAGTR